MIELTTFDDLKGLKPGHRVRVVADEDYQTEGSYSYDTEEETREAVEFELKKLESYEWVVVGMILEHACGECGSYVEDESLWGMVIGNTDAEQRYAAIEFVGEVL